MRVLPLVLALPFLTTFAPFGLAREPVSPPVLRLAAERVTLSAEQPDRRRVGALRFLEGWRLRSNDPRFGGLSAMHVANGEVIAVSDAARLFTFAVPREPGLAPLRGRWLGGSVGSEKRMRDSEGMAVAGSRAWISFERSNAVSRYDRESWREQATARPEAMRRWAANAGAEAIVRLADGRFLVLCEGRMNKAGATPALLFEGDPAVPGTPVRTLRYQAPKDFRITDAAVLPDGSLLLLNRRVSWLHGFEVKLTLVERPRLAAGATLSGREIAAFDARVTTDNYEALSVTQEGGRTILWLASDDNFMSFQRTLLMKFALER